MQDKGKPLDMGPTWSPKNGFGTCCGFPVNGFENGGQSNGSSGGSAISPSGWLFNICNETSRCAHQPAFPLALWFIRLWEVSWQFIVVIDSSDSDGCSECVGCQASTVHQLLLAFSPRCAFYGHLQVSKSEGRTCIALPGPALHPV